MINLVSVWGLSGLFSLTLTGIEEKSREEGRTGGGGGHGGDSGGVAGGVVEEGGWEGDERGSHGDVPAKLV